MVIATSKRSARVYKFPRLLHIHVLIKVSGLRDKFRRLLTKLIAKKPAHVEINDNVVSPLGPYKDAFVQQQWVFVENFFESEVRDNILKSWPNFYYFSPVARITKSYDLGFQWSAQQELRPQYLDHHPTLDMIYNYLDSDEFAQKVTEFCDDGITRTRYNTLLTRAYTGSSVIPHKDTVTGTKEGEHFLNFVIFVNGTGGLGKGGLCIMDGPEFDNILFEPQNLVNTALVYRSSADIWHGFAPMRFGSFRWTINCQFCSQEWLRSKIAK